MFNNLLLLALLSTASAEDFTVLAEDQPAPFEGVLLSVPAAAEVLAQHEEVELKCELELEFQLDRAGTQCNLDKKLLEARIITLDQQYTEVITQKDLVIDKQQAIIKKQAPHRKWLWFAGGIVLGGATYYGIQQVDK
jgi:hypothetical protein|tara:strand:+ start:191 stop:601 length:411 start_codon:yes stop_codon:yes gene_type:complete